MSESKPNPKFTLNAAFFQEIKDDHQQLQCVLKRLRELSNHPSVLSNHKREFSSLLTDLVDQLAFHFALEEAYGYFEDAIDRAPQFHTQAGKLRSQHSQLFVLCGEIAESVAAKLMSNAPEIDEIMGQFRDFDQLLQLHESAELKLIMDAMNLDVGGGD